MLCVDVGDKLKMARRYHAPALTQSALAQVLGVDTSTVGRWEADNHIPSGKLPQLAMLLNVKEEWFYDGSDLPPSAARRTAYEPENMTRVMEPTRADRYIASGLNVALPLWRGVAASSGEECWYMEAETPEFGEVPYFLTLGHPERHILAVAKGMSMAPRVGHADKAIVRLDPDVPPGHIVVAENTEAKRYIKKLLRADGHLELHSLGDGFSPIVELDGWTLLGGVTAILHPYEAGRPNLEWDDGRYLRA